LILPSKPTGSFYIIGDVHGEYEAFVTLLDGLPLAPDDTVIQLGDCINRGPRSFEVVEYCLSFDRCRRYMLGGNHEFMFYRYLTEGDPVFLSSGGETTLRSYQRHGWAPEAGDPHSVPQSHLCLYSVGYPWMAWLIQTPEYLFAHAGYDLALAPHEQSRDVLGWGKVVGQERSQTSQLLIRGHTVYPDVLFTSEGWIGVDTGCGKGGALSCLRLPDRTVFTALTPARGR
jgi:serine/threonine protein phosphatase 1